MEMTFRAFRKKYDLTLDQIKILDKRKIIEVFQGGYRGHSTCHPKKIRILSLRSLEKYLGFNMFTPQEQEHEYEYQPTPSVGCLTVKNNLPQTHHTQKRNPTNPNERLNEPIRNDWVIHEYLRKV